jgi:hypothetical protein
MVVSVAESGEDLFSEGIVVRSWAEQRMHSALHSILKMRWMVRQQVGT